MATGPATGSTRATLESVARHAQVSRQTVSNVINAPHLVRPDTMARVQRAIDDLGYRPHLAARQMRTRRSRVIGLRMEPERDGVNGVIFDRFLHALTEHAQGEGYRIMLFTAADDRAEIRAYDEMTQSLDLDGFVLTATHHDDPRAGWLTERGLPYVTFGRPWSAEPSHAWADVDGRVGMRAATEHLADVGHRRIGFVGWPAGSDVGDDRRAGWVDAIAGRGLGGARGPGPADLVIETEDGIGQGRAATARLLDGPAPTAIACASDSLALGALTELGARGLRPGADVAVVGFDDTSIAPALGLSSVHQPVADVAGACLRLLLAQLDAPAGARAAQGHVLLAPELRVRASSLPGPDTRG
jgi:DNA-binding LacI/PurR family transcriptional regulator